MAASGVNMSSGMKRSRRYGFLQGCIVHSELGQSSVQNDICKSFSLLSNSAQRCSPLSLPSLYTKSYLNLFEIPESSHYQEISRTSHTIRHICAVQYRSNTNSVT